uniref:Transposase (putative) gypsy type domain-containing protein n=1 Tax=Tanacetum cinerariifolium TaxID=118510 RepID=A0A699GZ26_TANCI|nr:hypothetical protein [Tanacetum cinerariifolium]
MSAITDVKCVLTHKALDALCKKFYIPKEVHPVLPNQYDTMHERTAGKIGLYTRFFDFANLRLPLSTFLVDVLRHFRINISQLSIIEAAKVSHFEILCRVYGIIPIVGLFRCFYVNSKKSGWISFTKRSDKASKWISLLSSIARIPPNELDASVERLFDKGGSGNQTEQVDSIDDGKDVDIQSVIKAANTVVEDVAPMQSKRQGKRKFVVVDAGEASHPPKKLKNDYGTQSGTSISGKSRSALKRLLAGAVFNAEVKVVAMPTLPFMTTSVSFTSEREGGDHIDSVTGPNLHAIGAPPRFVISSDSSHHSGTNVAEAEVDYLIRSSVLIMTIVTTITSTVDPALVAKKKLVKPSLFCVDSSSAGGTDPTTGVFSDLTGSDFLIGAICTVIDPDTDLQKVYVPQWSVTNGSVLMTVAAARQMYLSVEVRIHVEYNVKEKRRLKSVTERQLKLLRPFASVPKPLILKLLKKSLLDETDALNERNAILEKERNALDLKVTKLEASVVSKERELTDLNALVTSVKSQNDILVDRLRAFILRWLLIHGMDLAIVKCLNSPEYLSALGAPIGKAIEKGMQDGLSAGIVHGKEGRALTDVAAHNPSTEKSNKDASVEAVMNILHLEGPLTEKIGLNELQPNVDHLMVPIHRSPDKVVVGVIVLSLSLDVSSFQVWRNRENIANQRSALHDVFVPLVDPFSAADLTGTEGNSDTAPATANTNTDLSITFASASSIDPIFVDDYEVVGAEDQAVADENAASFSNVDDAKLNITE